VSVPRDRYNISLPLCFTIFVSSRTEFWFLISVSFRQPLSFLSQCKLTVQTQNNLAQTQAALIPQATGELFVPAQRTIADPLAFSLIIPTFNEAGNVRPMVQCLTELLDPVFADGYELIWVDDDSPDRTWEMAQALMTAYPQLRVMRRQGERGLSTAVIRGWQVARGEVLGVIDGDLQHPPEILLHLLEQMRQGAELAIASRHVSGGGISEWSLFRRITSRGAQLLGLLILPQVVGRITDPMSGYFLVQRRCIEDSRLNPAGYKILLEVLGRGTVERIAEVGYVFQERQDGESKVTWRQSVEYLQHLIRLRSRGRLERLQQKFPLGRFLRFGVVGFSGLFVDMALFALLFSTLRLDVIFSTLVSAEIALINNFFWNDLWTFGDISRNQPGKRQWLQRLLKFNVVCGAGIVLQGTLVGLLSKVLGMDALLAKLLAIAIVVLWNFWVNFKLSWRVTDVKK
jgi:dolichol-phosphate mannosyltransferase